jgi:hypothetical protein
MSCGKPFKTMKTLIPALFLALISVTAIFAKGGPAINDKCPVDGKTVRIIYRVFTDAGTVAFCCVDCMESYKTSPSRYTVTPKPSGK